jgi:DUF3040 family protein
MSIHDEEAPLSEHERAALEALEAALRDSDPSLGQRLVPGRHLRLPVLKPRWRLILAVGTIVFGLAVIVGTLAVSLPAAVVGIMITGAGLGWALTAVRPHTRQPPGRPE